MALDGVEVSQFRKGADKVAVLLWSVSGGSLEKKLSRKSHICFGQGCSE